jgi:hypothetical protein
LLQALVDDPEAASILLNALYAELTSRSGPDPKVVASLVDKLSYFPDDHSYPPAKIKKMIAVANSKSALNHLKDKFSSFENLNRFDHGE